MKRRDMISSQHAMELLRRLNRQRVTGKLENLLDDVIDKLIIFSFLDQQFSRSSKIKVASNV